MKIDIKSTVLILPILLLGFFMGRYWGAASIYNGHMSKSESGEEIVDHMQEMGEVNDRDEFIAMKDHMIGEMVNDEEYKCCLEKPCVYCIEKTPGHGEGATCKCLEDIMNGVHPCGECIGEILEGHGNRFIAKYFATAIAEEAGVEHTDTIKQIVANKYNVSVEDQI